MTDQSLIRLSKSCLGQTEKDAVAGVLSREYLGMGAEVQEFEAKLGEYFGRPVACVVNGTAALHLALQCCGVGPGDEVLVPSLTYVASFQAISATGAIPVACDVEPGSLTIDWRDAEERLTARTRCVMPVHYTGGVADPAACEAFARRFGLRVVEDAAHAFGTTWQGRRVGGFGDIACFSFDGIKNITSGEGGCVVTSDAQVLQRVRDARLLGVEKDSERRYEGGRSWEFDVESQGWRYHMSNIMAAIGIAQLARRAELAARRQHLAATYDALLAGHTRIRHMDHDYSRVVPHIYVVRIAGLRDREAVRARMLDGGVQTGIHYQPNHTLSLYGNTSGKPLPATDAAYPEMLTLPLHPDLDDDDPARVLTCLKDALRHDR